MPINVTTSDVLGDKLTGTRWQWDWSWIHTGGCAFHRHPSSSTWAFIAVHLWTQKRMSNALWQQQGPLVNQASETRSDTQPWHASVFSTPSRTKHEWRGHHCWHGDWLREWSTACDVCGRGKLRYTQLCAPRHGGGSCLYVSRLKEQAGKCNCPFAMWANCCRARRRRLQGDGFPVNCGPVHMHPYWTADATHKRSMNCWYFPVVMDSALDIFMRDFSFVCWWVSCYCGDCVQVTGFSGLLEKDNGCRGLVAEAHMITVILVLFLPQPHERLLHYHPYLVRRIYEALSLAEQAGKLHFRCRTEKQMKTMVFPPLHCTSHVNRLFTIWLFVSKKKHSHDHPKSMLGDTVSVLPPLLAWLRSMNL